MTTSTPTRSTIKQVEQLWFDYNDKLKQVEILRQVILNPYDAFPDENQGGGVNSVRNISDPTADMALRLHVDEDINKLLVDIRTVERVYNKLPDNYKEMVRLRYFTNKVKWTWDEISIRHGISRRQVMRWRDAIMQATIEMI